MQIWHPRFGTRLNNKSTTVDYIYIRITLCLKIRFFGFFGSKITLKIRFFQNSIHLFRFFCDARLHLYPDYVAKIRFFQNSTHLFPFFVMHACIYVRLTQLTSISVFCDVVRLHLNLAFFCYLLTCKK